MKFDLNVFMATIASWVVARAGERSSYLGLIALASSLGIVMSPELAQAIMVGAGLLSGALLLATKDKATTEVIQVTEVKAVEEPKANAKKVLLG